MTYKECAYALVESLTVCTAIGFPILLAAQIIADFYN